ncbi:MAG: valine--tRNA ligase [Candidatus Riflebacteria bacterium]|nr:valine--tRNA ligase [Candidatus Riflebacteria bacterium]
MQQQDELTKTYEPKTIEQRIYDRWIETGVFGARAGGPGRSYCIVIPPPNITGQLHMGHALNNAVQDILIRWQRMKGQTTLWLPGTDHAGIATQAVVERDLVKKGIRRREMGRERFLEKVWEWREKYGSTIIAQLKKIGSSCDWSRLRFTLDDGCSRAVRRVFCELFGKGLIYRGNYIVNWCPTDHTALSDEEVEHKETAGKLYYVSYPGIGGAPGVQVATTRPETMLGDVAVAVHPDDGRYRDLVGKRVLLPVVNREIPVIADRFVDPAFGTGAVKITPAHDPNDFLAGQRNGLTPLNVMHPDGTINENGGPFAGMDRFRAREKMIERLTEAGLLDRVEDHVHQVGHCYRCHSVVEPYLSTQWFVKMQDLARPAVEAVRSGRIKFHPERWTKVYFDWMDNIRDWCISRQLWWGHRIPAFYCSGCQTVVVQEEGAPASCPACSGTAFTQDEDVLDTWFSSALWPFSTLGWPEPTADLSTFYPTSTLVTDRGIIFFWVARRIMSGLQFMGEVPFSDVYIHGTILDDQGRKMSKSLGNGIDPLEVVDQYGADAMRYSLVMLSSGGQDIKLAKSKFEMGRNFANKVWNAARFLLMYLKETDVSAPPVIERSQLEFADRWILSRLSRLVSAVEDSLSAFDMFGAVKALYDFTWHEYCDYYVEFVKPRLGSGDAQGLPSRQAALATSRYVFETVLRLLHPIMPFITEEIFQHLTGGRELLAVAAWPRADQQFVDPAVEEEMERIQKVIVAVRTIRSSFTTKDNQLKPNTELDVLVRADAGGKWSCLVGRADLVRSLARVGKLTVQQDIHPPFGSASEIVEDIEIYVPLAGLIDYKKEEERLSRELALRQRDLEMVRKKLSQESFVKNAPPEIVEKEKNKQEDLQVALRKIENLLSSLRQQR